MNWATLGVDDGLVEDDEAGGAEGFALLLIDEFAADLVLLGQLGDGGLSGQRMQRQGLAIQRRKGMGRIIQLMVVSLRRSF